jgi:hypothetical protein
MMRAMFCRRLEPRLQVFGVLACAENERAPPSIDTPSSGVTADPGSIASGACSEAAQFYAPWLRGDVGIEP